MPTGTPIHDISDQLRAAADRVLAREGPDGLTSRAVTAEARVAKGVLHRHFADFDAFLAMLALAHVERIETVSSQLRASAGTETPADNLARALSDALSPAAAGIVALACARHRLGDKLRLVTPEGVPLLAECTRMVAAYLTAERGLGRLAIDADVDALAVAVVGGAHLLAADPSADGARDVNDLRAVVAATVGQAGATTNASTRSHVSRPTAV